LPTPAAAPDFERFGAREVLEHMVREFHPRLYVACSFQKEASVIFAMLAKVEPEARVFVLDTGVGALRRDLRDLRRMEEPYGITIARYRGEWVDGLWADDPDACCAMRKVKPLEDALSGVDAWITGLRRDQTAARAGTPKLGWDAGHGNWEAAPLADWTERDVWRCIADNDVPYNPLHDQGFQSIGCTHCTVPGAGREGRWAGTDRIECGLHLPSHS
jgi:phosphoadenosine phosphosulfate reductase